MTDRATCWSVTINNPTKSDEEHIALARQKGWRVEGQLEVGEKGTTHYQLCVKTPQVRFSAMKKAFPRAHIEVARNVAALEQYVLKDETRVGQLVSPNEMYPSQQRVWDMFSYYIWDYYLDWKDRPSGIEEWNGEKWLEEFDKWVHLAIQQGYVVEGIAVNPQTRSSIKNYGFSIYLRSKGREFNGFSPPETKDRQTDENIVAGEGITNASSHQASSEEV